MEYYCKVLLSVITYLSGGETMFNFLLLDNKKYKKGDNIEDFKVSNYIDEPNEILVQHLAHIYCEMLHIAMQFDVDEKEVNALSFEYLEEYYPEDVKKLIKGRMKKGASI